MSSNVLLNFSASSMLDQVTNLFTVGATSTVYVDLDLTDVYTIAGMFVVNYTQTTSPTGLTCEMFQGYGPSLGVNMYQPIPCILQNSAPDNPRVTGQVYSTCGLQTNTGGDPISMSVVATNNSTAATYNTPWSLDKQFMSKFVTFKFTNRDTANSARVQVRLNV